MSNPGFLPRIESLRGLAAIMVVAYHVGQVFDGSQKLGVVDEIASSAFVGISNGIGAVVAFFVISGFVLARSLDANPDATRFFTHRLRRLFPAGAAVVSLLVAVHYSFGIYVGHEASFDALNILLNMLMIRSDINVPMWSLTVECFAAPVIFLSVLLFRRHGLLPLWSLVAVLFGLSFWGPYVHMLGGATNLAPLYAFIVGIIAYFEGGRLTSNLSIRAATYSVLLSFLIFLICGFKKQTAPILALECLSAASMVALVAYSNTFILKPLDFRLVRFYGQISYSFYLLHMLGIQISLRLIEPLKLSGGSVFGAIVLTTLVAILCTTPVAYLFWRLIEMPGIQIGRSIKSTTVVAGSR